MGFVTIFESFPPGNAEVSHVVVPVLLKPGFNQFEVRPIFQDKVNIEDRLGCQPGHGRAPNVFNADVLRFEDAEQIQPQLLKAGLPGWIIRHDLHLFGTGGA